MEWFRAAELSCDRAAALVIRDPLAVCRTLMVIAAGAEAAHYAERFRDTFKELGDSIKDAGQQLSDWLRKTRDGDT